MTLLTKTMYATQTIGPSRTS